MRGVHPNGPGDVDKSVLGLSGQYFWYGFCNSRAPETDPDFSFFFCLQQQKLKKKTQDSQKMRRLKD